MTVILRVTGLPAPKGSSRAMIRGGRAVNVPSGSDANRVKLASWKTSVVDAWRAHLVAGGARPVPGREPLAVGVVFRFPMRKVDLDTRGGVGARATHEHTTKPDADKLLRATWDALTEAGTWTDDAQIWCGPVAKVYVPPGVPTGADIAMGACWEDVSSAWHDELLIAIERIELAKTTAQEARTAARHQRRAP